MTATRWLIQGRVQGVGFRWFTLRRAHHLGLAGWVRNLPDGRVEVVASGEPSNLEGLDHALRRGPTAARVDSVERSDYPHEGDVGKMFTIK